MTINTAENIEIVSTRQVLFADKHAVRKLALALLVNQAGANVERILDMGGDYETRADVEQVFATLKEQTLETLDDFINDLRLSLAESLKDANVVAMVRRMDYDRSGNLSDVTVDLHVE